MNLSEVLTPFKVGLLVIAGAVAGIFLAARLTSDGLRGAEDRVKVYATFNDVTGLAERSRIRMAGLPIGEIGKIELKGEKAQVELYIDRKIMMYQGLPKEFDMPDTTPLDDGSPPPPGKTVKKTRFVNGALIAKKSASVLGDYYLELTPGKAGPKLKDGDQIRNVKEGNDIDEIFAKLKDISTDIQRVTRALSAVFGGEQGQKSLEEILRNLQTILKTVSDAVVEIKPRISSITTNVDRATGDLASLANKGEQSIDQILSDSKDVVRDTKAIVQEVRFVVGQSSGDVQAGIGTLRGTLARLQTTLDSLNYSLQNVQDITDKINEGEGDIGKLVNEPKLTNKADGILTEAKKFTDSIGRLQTIVSLRSEYHTTQGQFKNVVGLRLQPRRDKYYLIEIVDDYRGDTSAQRRIVLTDNPNVPGGSYTETTVSTTDNFRVSLQMAMGYQVADWLMLTGRFGLIESSGGVGVNLEFFKDRSLMFQADLYDFLFAENPRLRTFATFNVYKSLFLTVGMDDLMNKELRTPFFGFGFSFNDEDLKALITTTGVPTP